MSDEKEYYTINKFWDNIIDSTPGGWRIYYKLCDIKRFFKKTYQKITRGYSDEECWNLDYTIAKFILPRLRHFKKNCHTLTWRRHKIVNGEVVELVESEMLEPTDEKTWLNSEEWDEVMENMIFAFEFILKEEEWSDKSYGVGFFDEPYDFISNVGKKNRKKFPIDPDYSMYEKARKHADRGMKLFGLYHNGLWD